MARNELHWQAPTVMVSGLAVGIGLAVGHHFFYHSLDRTEVSGVPRSIAGWQTNQQQINIAGGTALAFLVNASLVLAVGSAYMQLFFQHVTSTNCEVHQLDVLFSGLHDLTSFLNVKTYYKYLLLALIALTSWLLPLASVITPAALTVGFGHIEPSTTFNSSDSQPAFESFALSSFTSVRAINYTQLGSFQRQGPAEEVSRIANAAAAAGTILPIQAPGINTTWTTTFELPRLTCQYLEPTGSVSKSIAANILDALKATTKGNAMGENYPYMFSYLSWLEWSHLNLETGVMSNQPLPFQKSVWLNVTSWNLQAQTTDDFPFSFGSPMYIGVFDRAAGPEIPAVWLRGKADNIFTKAIIDWYFETAKILRCDVGAANYSLRFTYNGTDQAQHIEILKVSNVSFTATQPDSVYMYPPGNDQLSLDIGRQDLRMMAYNSIWQTFSGLVLGASNSVSNVRGTGELPMPNPVTAEMTGPTHAVSVKNTGPLQVYQTQVFATSLSDSEELSTLIQRENAVTTNGTAVIDPNKLLNTTTGKTLQQLISLLPPQGSVPAARKSLQDSIEELFFNVSISMASSPQLRYNDSSPFAPEQVLVTSSLSGNIYTYSPEKLWLPYGLAIGVTLLAVLVGLWSIFRSGTCFTTNFSTILRISKNSDTGINMLESHPPGKDPLPKKLADATLRCHYVERKKLQNQDYVEVVQADAAAD